MRLNPKYYRTRKRFVMGPGGDSYYVKVVRGYKENGDPIYKELTGFVRKGERWEAYDTTGDLIDDYAKTPEEAALNLARYVYWDVKPEEIMVDGSRVHDLYTVGVIFVDTEEENVERNPHRELLGEDRTYRDFYTVQEEYYSPERGGITLYGRVIGKVAPVYEGDRYTGLWAAFDNRGVLHGDRWLSEWAAAEQLAKGVYGSRIKSARAWRVRPMRRIISVELDPPLGPLRQSGEHLD